MPKSEDISSSYHTSISSGGTFRDIYIYKFPLYWTHKSTVYFDVSNSTSVHLNRINLLQVDTIFLNLFITEEWQVHGTFFKMGNLLGQTGNILGSLPSLSSWWHLPGVYIEDLNTKLVRHSSGKCVSNYQMISETNKIPNSNVWFMNDQMNQATLPFVIQTVKFTYFGSPLYCGSDLIHTWNV